MFSEVLGRNYECACRDQKIERWEAGGDGDND